MKRKPRPNRNESKKVATVTVDLTDAPAGYFQIPPLTYGYCTTVNPIQGQTFISNLFAKITTSDSTVTFDYMTQDLTLTSPTFLQLGFGYAYYFNDLGDPCGTPFVMAGYRFEDLFPCNVDLEDFVEVSVRFKKNDNCIMCLPTVDCASIPQYPYLLEITQFTLTSASLKKKYVCTHVNQFADIPSVTFPENGIYYPINIQLFDSITDTCKNPPSAFPTSTSALNDIITPYDNVTSFDQVDTNQMAGTKKFNDLFIGYTSYLNFLKAFQDNMSFYTQYRSILLAVDNGDLNPFSNSMSNADAMSNAYADNKSTSSSSSSSYSYSYSYSSYPM